jgi:hypothetical protein
MNALKVMRNIVKWMLKGSLHQNATYILKICLTLPHGQITTSQRLAIKDFSKWDDAFAHVLTDLADALLCVRDWRARYDGLERSPTGIF